MVYRRRGRRRGRGRRGDDARVASAGALGVRWRRRAGGGSRARRRRAAAVAAARRKHAALAEPPAGPRRRSTRRRPAARRCARRGRRTSRPSFGSVTGADAKDGSRIAAGGLNNPIILDRFAAGVSVVAAGHRLRPHAAIWSADCVAARAGAAAGRRSPSAPTCCCASIAPTSARCARRRSCASRRTTVERAAARRRSGERAGAEQPEVGPRRQLREGEPQRGAAAAAAGAQRSRSARSPRSPPRSVAADAPAYALDGGAAAAAAACRRARRSSREALRDRPDVVAERSRARVGGEVRRRGARAVVPDVSPRSAPPG